MPTKLHYFKRRPKFMGKREWKGKGSYYKLSKNHWQKHNAKVDKKRGGRIGRGKHRHLNDKGRR